MQCDLNARYDLWPTMGEVARAKQVFTDEIGRYEEARDLPQDNRACMQNKTAITCALAEVWRQGRIYQRDCTESAFQHEEAKASPWIWLRFAAFWKSVFRKLRQMSKEV